MAQSSAPTVSDNSAPKQPAMLPKAQQRPPLDAEIVGGDVSYNSFQRRRAMRACTLNM
jgi:hypothetical protein